MSQRLGMADGRCFTINTASGLFNDDIMQKNGIQYEDNYSYRKLLQEKGPDMFQEDQKLSGCATCNTPVMSVPNIY